MPLEPKIRKNFTPSRTKKLFKFGLYAKLKFEFSCSQFGLSTLDYDSENSINQTRYLPQNHLTKETEQPEIILDEQHNYRFDPHITVASKTSRKQASKHIWTQKTQESFQNVQKVWRTHLLNKSGLFDSRDKIRDIVNRGQRPHTKALQPRTRWRRRRRRRCGRRSWRCAHHRLELFLLTGAHHRLTSGVRSVHNNAILWGQ